MRMIELATVKDVVAALGGRGEVARLVDVAPTAISNWSKSGRFACNTYAVMIDALHAGGKTAPPTLWAMKESRSLALATKRQGAAIKLAASSIRANIAETKRLLSELDRQLAAVPVSWIK